MQTVGHAANVDSRFSGSASQNMSFYHVYTPLENVSHFQQLKSQNDPYRAGIDFSRQNLTSVDVRF